MNSEKTLFTISGGEFLHMVVVKDKSIFMDGISQGGVGSDVLLLILISCRVETFVKVLNVENFGLKAAYISSQESCNNVLVG